MRILRLNLDAYGRCKNVGIQIGDQVTVVVGPNEAGKSTAPEALGDLLWGIPTNTPRASNFTRPQLRIGAAIETEVDGPLRTFTRKSTGLFEADLVTEVPCPWDPKSALGRDWWRTRLGINHEDLRDAGRRAFAGDGDLADIIFAAREGRSAKEILEQITKRIDQIFRSHRGARNVLLRVADRKYQDAVGNLKDTLTCADKVLAQRALVKSLETQFQKAGDTKNQATRRLKVAEEDQRIVEAVLKLNQARREIAAIAADGPRLSPPELKEYREANDSLQDVATRIDRFNSAIAKKQQEIDALPIDDELLDDKSAIDRLQPKTQARIDDLARAEHEHAPAAAELTAQLRDMLRSIGIDATDDLEAALEQAIVREDHAATLDDLAARIEDLEEKGRRAREHCDNNLAGLVGKGIAINLATSHVPHEETIADLREKFADARDRASTAQALLDKAREETNALRSGAPTPVLPPALTHAAVVDARRNRDDHWHAVRQSWLTGELPNPESRYDMAGELDGSLLDADRTADEEADERARVAAQDALVTAHVEGFDAAKERESSAHTNLVAVTQECKELEAAWNTAWSEIGVTPAPSTAASSAVADLIIAAHSAHREAQSASENLAQLSESWTRATESVGLSGADTTAAWRRQAEVLSAIRTTRASRTEVLNKESNARRKWDVFAREATDLLRCHAEAVEGQAPSSVQLEQGLTRLSRRLGEAAEAAATRAAYRELIQEQSDQRDDAQQIRQEASGALDRLAELHDLVSIDDLGTLAERAERASEPLEREASAHMDIRIKLDGASDPVVAIERLAGRDQVSVDDDVAEARMLADAADHEANRLLSELTTARDGLTELEKTSSAAEAESNVAAAQAEVAHLAEEWALLTLQRKLLMKALETLGSSDTRPLLDHAGRILEELTAGRWVALKAEDDGVSRKLSVIRSDAQPFSTSELSEGTADQVFLALRLAAVAELHKERNTAGEQTLPLVLDDILMTSDESRSLRILKALADLAPGLQVIVFTHHQFVADAAEQVDWATVSPLPAPSPIEAAVDSELLRAKLREPALMGTSG